MSTQEPKLLALVVDDSLVNRRLLCEMLRLLNYRTIEAEDGEQGVAMFSEHHPDVVFMDIEMPKMNGYEATRQIKKISGSTFVPLFVVTATTESMSLGDSIEAGADEFLTKPISMDLIKAKLAAMQRIRELHLSLDEQNKKMAAMHDQLHEEQILAETIFNNAVYASNIEVSNVSSKIIPASLFSGDTILIAQKPDGGINVLLGDFTGHGLGAALGTIPVADSFRVMTEKGLALKSIIAEINRKLERFLPSNMFMAATIVSTHIDSNVVEVYNAGLPDLLVVNKSSNKITEVASTHLPLGIIPMNETEISLEDVELKNDDFILCYSDGLTESRSPSGEEFGQDRLSEAALAVDKDPIEDILRQWADFCGDSVPHDDVTLVAVKSS